MTNELNSDSTQLMETTQARSLRTLQVKLIKIDAKVVRHKKRVFVQIFKKISRSRKFLIVQGNFGKFIDVVRGNYVF